MAPPAMPATSGASAIARHRARPATAAKASGARTEGSGRFTRRPVQWATKSGPLAQASARMPRGATSGTWRSSTTDTR